MSFDADRAHEVRNGFAVTKGPGWYAGEGTPVGCQAKLGSEYTDKLNGDKWLKVGPLSSEWRLQVTEDDNLDGGFANAVYLPVQCFDGGDANG